MAVTAINFRCTLPNRFELHGATQTPRVIQMNSLAEARRFV